MPYPPPIVGGGNRGMTLYPDLQYQNNVAYYNQPKTYPSGSIDAFGTPVGGGPGGNMGGGGGGGQGGIDWAGLFGPMFSSPAGAASGQTNAPRPPLRQNRAARGGGQLAQAGQYNPAAGIPAATTQPQTQVPGAGTEGGAGAGGNVAEISTGITAGQLPDSQIQQALQSMLAGGQRSLSIPGTLGYMPSSGQNITGGIYGDLMRQSTNRNMSELSRAASEQQAQMQHSFETAGASAGLSKMQLASDVNKENVTNNVQQRNQLINLISQLLGGFV